MISRVPRSLAIDPYHFVERVTPWIEKHDAHGLIVTIHRHWTLSQVVSLLEGDHIDARKVAALSLSLIGTETCLESLCKQLRDPDPVVRQMAEHSMWCIWFRNGRSEEANSALARGAQAFARKDVDGAIELFSRAIELDAGFAEAYNQRAMAHFVLESFENSAVDCEKAVSLMPMHFGAWAGLGHCLMNLGRLKEALRCYQQAMSINPHLECVGELIGELRCACPPEKD